MVTSKKMLRVVECSKLLQRQVYIPPTSLWHQYWCVSELGGPKSYLMASSDHLPSDPTEMEEPQTAVHGVSIMDWLAASTYPPEV